MNGAAELLDMALTGLTASVRITKAVAAGNYEEAAKYSEALKSLADRIQHDAEVMRDQLKQDSEL